MGSRTAATCCSVWHDWHLLALASLQTNAYVPVLNMITHRSSRVIVIQSDFTPAFLKLWGAPHWWGIETWPVGRAKREEIFLFMPYMVTWDQIFRDLEQDHALDLESDCAVCVCVQHVISVSFLYSWLQMKCLTFWAVSGLVPYMGFLFLCSWEYGPRYGI